MAGISFLLVDSDISDPGPLRNKLIKVVLGIPLVFENLTCPGAYLIALSNAFRNNSSTIIQITYSFFIFFLHFFVLQCPSMDGTFNCNYL